MARTGRPRKFDRAEAISRAMLLFWEHGYEATSLARLRTTMGGISSASFYAAFGSKEALFRDALALYADEQGLCIAPLFDAALSPSEAMEQALRASVTMQTDNGHPLGCLVCSATASCSPEAADVQRLVGEVRKANHDAIRSLVDRAICLDEDPVERDAEAIAATFNGFLLGISAQARDGVSRRALQSAVSKVMLLWPSNCGRAGADPDPAFSANASRVV